jgi:hypothetical protein
MGVLAYLNILQFKANRITGYTLSVFLFIRELMRVNFCPRIISDHAVIQIWKATEQGLG